ncbi:hypothetical protein N9D28_01345 [Luminiphilus sp.]|nr:hypothetical protein [Luminiphilus sp.]
MIKKHRILWAEALFFGVVCISYPRFLGWIDLYVIYLVLAFLVLLAMHEASQTVNKTVPKLAVVLTLLAFIMFYAVPFFPILDNLVPTKSGSSNLLSFIGYVSGLFALWSWGGHTYGSLDDETIEK